MILEKYENREFKVDEVLWDDILSNFKTNLSLFKRSHKNNYVVLFTAVTPIDLVRFIYDELNGANKLDEQEWPLIIDNKFIDKHFKNFSAEVAIVDEEEREMGDGTIIVFVNFVYEERNW